MASPGQTGGAVEFSVDKIELTNYYNVESAQPGAFQQRITYHVQNKSNFSRKVRVAVDDSSDPVS